MHIRNMRLYLRVHAAESKCRRRKKKREKFSGLFIAVSEYALAGTHQIALNTVRAIGDRNAAVMKHHGMAVCGSDMKNAFENAILFEETARIAWYEYDKEAEEEIEE